MKISHADPNVVTSIIKWLQDLYQTLPNGEIAKMKVQRGRFLEYLGMDFDFSVKKQVSIFMRHYVDKIIQEFPDPLRNKVISTPTTAKLYEIRNIVPKLNSEKKMTFHRIVAQLLYILKREDQILRLQYPF